MGKIDLIEGSTLVDWKNVSDPQQYIQSRTIGYQQELYALAAEMCLDRRIDKIEYRLIKRPSIKLCGKDSSPSTYEQRCVEWLKNEPGAILVHPVDINPARFKAAKLWLWNVSQRILDARRDDLWLTNENACRLWMRECEYMPLCICEANGGDCGWMIKERYEERPQHEELEDVEPSDKDTLTYSSGTTFTACERKYYWRYFMSIRPQRDDTSDALYTGSASHIGMEWYAKEGIDSALDHITKWADVHPVIGMDAATKQDQAIARARAIVRVAAERWPR